MRRTADKKWCEYQTKCVEDTEPGSWTCTAHLDEGRAMQCHKKNMRDAKKEPGMCVDAEPPDQPRKQPSGMPDDKEIREAVDADFRQHLTNQLTPDRGYAIPIPNVKRLIEKTLSANARKNGWR